MQHTLTFVKDKVKYVSKPFDFEAMCIINDAHNDENKKGPLSICRDALDYMFEGTEDVYKRQVHKSILKRNLYLTKVS